MDWNNWNKWLEQVMLALRAERNRLGVNAAVRGAPSDQGKIQTKFENSVASIVQRSLPNQVRMEIEGYEPRGESRAEWIVSVDPTDGTAGDARSAGVALRGLPVSTVIAIRENVPSPTFGSVHYAGLLDLRDGEIYLAGPREAYRYSSDGNRTLATVAQHNLHAPAVSIEMARRANAFMRFLIPYGIYPEVFSDSHSSATAMLWALLGYSDAYLNFNLPGFTGAGQRGHELGAMAVFCRSLGAYAAHVSSVDGQLTCSSLDQASYDFDGQTSVVLGPDERIVQHYLALINASLRREIVIRDASMSVNDLLAELNRQVPNERWSLPLIRE